MCIDPTRCEWFVDNRLSIHSGKDKSKSVLFASKHKIKKAPKLNIAYKNIQIKQHSKVRARASKRDHR